MTKYGSLTIICNGCGEPMRDFGIWPVQHPKIDKPMNTQTASCYACETCKTPHSSFKGGIPVRVCIIE